MNSLAIWVAIICVVILEVVIAFQVTQILKIIGG